MFGLAVLAVVALPMSIHLAVAGGAVIGVFVLSAGWIAGSIGESRATLREVAGYTTVYERHYELWQLEPRTGAVVRRPGERQYKKSKSTKS
jgi:hypothetical protein